VPTTEDEYRRFGAVEARGKSPLYEQLAYGVAGDPDLIRLLSTLPPDKRQPNLLFAAARLAGGTPSDYPRFRQIVLDHRDAVLAAMRTRRVQTNEPARYAALYPLLATLPQPLALLEVGASAGLGLLLDRYRYDYGGIVAGAADSPVTVHCRVDGAPFPAPGPVTVAWRAGIDLNPLDVTDPDDVAWLRTLVWPEQHERRRRLDAALALAQADPPRVVRGDLNARLAEVAAGAPAGATLVVLHTAVLYYVPAPDRATFAAQVGALGARWLAQELPEVLPVQLTEPAPAGTLSYLVALDRQPAAFAAIHGGWLRWFATSPGA
jgi:hypothetical protein